jgi:hypothetical protein
MMFKAEERETMFPETLVSTFTVHVITTNFISHTKSTDFPIFLFFCLLLCGISRMV